MLDKADDLLFPSCPVSSSPASNSYRPVFEKRTLPSTFPENDQNVSWACHTKPFPAFAKSLQIPNTERVSNLDVSTNNNVHSEIAKSDYPAKQVHSKSLQETGSSSVSKNSRVINDFNKSLCNQKSLIQIPAINVNVDVEGRNKFTKIFSCKNCKQMFLPQTYLYKIHTGQMPVKVCNSNVFDGHNLQEQSTRNISGSVDEPNETGESSENDRCFSNQKCKEKFPVNRRIQVQTDNKFIGLELPTANIKMFSNQQEIMKRSQPSKFSYTNISISNVTQKKLRRTTKSSTSTVFYPSLESSRDQNPTNATLIHNKNSILTLDSHSFKAPTPATTTTETLTVMYPSKTYICLKKPTVPVLPTDATPTVVRPSEENSFRLNSTKPIPTNNLHELQTVKHPCDENSFVPILTTIKPEITECETGVGLYSSEENSNNPYVTTPRMLALVNKSTDIVKQHSRNLCSFTGCRRTKARYPELHFFTFPVRRPSICDAWIRNCGNEELDKATEKTLRNKLVCEKHFEDSCFTSTMKSRLLGSAVPTISSFVDIEDASRVVTEGVQVVQEQKSEPQRTIHLSEEECGVENTISLLPDNNACEIDTGFFSSNENSNDPNITTPPMPIVENKSTDIIKKHSRNRCSFTECRRNKARYPDLHFFTFPIKRPSICDAWIRNCGNEKLDKAKNKTLSSKLVCEKHFEDSCFTSTLKTRLHECAIPTILFSKDIEDAPKTVINSSDETSQDPNYTAPSTPSVIHNSNCIVQKRNRNLCSFIDCGRSKDRFPALRFFAFPVSRPSILDVWLRNCANEALDKLTMKALKRKVVCEKHFEDSCFKRPAKTILHATAVPTVLSRRDIGD